MIPKEIEGFGVGFGTPPVTLPLPFRSVPMPGRGGEDDERNITSPDNRQACRPGDPVPTMHEKPMAVAFQESQSGFRERDTHATLDSNNGSRRHQGVMAKSGVRRLTPVECARLQGFPDDWLEGLSDSAAYRCLGNAVSVPVACWLGKRILENAPESPVNDLPAPRFNPLWGGSGLPFEVARFSS